MKRVLKITATNGSTTAKVRIEVECRWDDVFCSTRERSRQVLHGIASGVMETLSDASYFRVPLSCQRVGR